MVNRYIHCTFIVDTGRPFHMTLSPLAMDVQKDANIVVDRDGQGVIHPVWLPSKSGCQVVATPVQHRPKNLIGLRILLLLGLHVDSRTQSHQSDSEELIW